MSTDVEQLALFMNARDQAESGTVAWSDLGEDGRESYRSDAALVIEAMKRLGWKRAGDDEIENLRAARAETWDEAVAAVFAWWSTPEEARPIAIVNPYGVGTKLTLHDCRECREGKHGACNGAALIENGDDITAVDCACSVLEHRGAGSDD
jgi:hypothetical protein